MLVMYATVGRTREELCRYEENGAGRDALLHRAIADFELQVSDAQPTADQTQMRIKLELVDEAAESVVVEKTIIPAEIQNSAS